MDVFGTNGDNILNGTQAADDIRGRAGDDIIYGRGGNDEIRGGYGDDQNLGGAGNDVINGGRGLDFDFGGGGNDRIIQDSTGGNGEINSGSGTDTVVVNGSNSGNDIFSASGSEDIDFERFNLDAYRLEVEATEEIELNARGGNDSLTVEDVSTAALDLFTYTGGAGRDTLAFDAGAGADFNFTDFQDNNVDRLVVRASEDSAEFFGDTIDEDDDGVDVVGGDLVVAFDEGTTLTVDNQESLLVGDDILFTALGDFA